MGGNYIYIKPLTTGEAWDVEKDFRRKKEGEGERGGGGGGRDSQQQSNDGEVDNATPNLGFLPPLSGASTAAAAADTDEVDGHQDQDTHTDQDGDTRPYDDRLET